MCLLPVFGEKVAVRTEGLRAPLRATLPSPGASIPKLFVAALLAPDLLPRLIGAQPPPAPGIRLTQPDQLHITVHYLGEADLHGTIAALSTLSAAPVPLVLEGVGQFVGRDGAVTLWAGVKPGAGLSALHAAVAEALAPTGFRPEARPWNPHISLARCEPPVSAALVESFRERRAGFRAESRIEAVGLYSSVFVDGTPVYTCEAMFGLKA